MKMLDFLPRGSALPTAIALLALAVATTGTAVAATGQLVNIVDPVTSANAARVTAGGALNVSGTVAAREAPPTTPFSTQASIVNFASATFDVVTPPTTATVAINRMVFSNSVNNHDAWETFVYQVPGTTAAECEGFGFGTAFRRITTTNVRPGESFNDQIPTAILVKPLTAGQSWCLVAGAQPPSTQTGTNTSPMYINVSGYTVSGTFTPPSTGPSRAGSTAGGAAGPDR